ncbi:MAG: FHA domain-containing protein [Candidatus Eremiobacteraeota bacterium]|nr:FHA domain-containing protein [Candidatus Eremiobacteraeota bacterium]
MAKLILSMDGLVLKEIPLVKERTTIGRRATNDIQIDNLAMSGEHAVIVQILNDCFLEDLGSTNGTMVNGQPIKKHFLQHNDVIELGKYRLKYINEQTGTQQSAEFEKTMVLRPSAVPKVGGATRTGADTQIGAAAGGATTPMGAGMSAPPAPQPAPAPAANVLGAVQILNGPNAGKELELSKPLTTLGKPGVQVAVITRRPQGYFITHVEGASFPIVNGKTIDAQAHPLKDHDILEISGTKMEFFIKT